MKFCTAIRLETKIQADKAVFWQISKFLDWKDNSYFSSILFFGVKSFHINTIGIKMAYFGNPF